MSNVIIKSNIKNRNSAFAQSEEASFQKKLVQFFSKIKTTWSDYARRVELENQIANERKLLADMSDQQLADMGITFSQAIEESQRTDISSERFAMGIN
jgi:uncharacterized protein YjiS (DUF1127 family)